MGDLGGKSYAPEGEISADEKTWGMFAHLSGIIAGFFGFNFLGPLIIWLIKKDASPYVAKQAMHALYFQGALWVLIWISAVLTMVCIGFILLPIVGIGGLVYSIVGTVKANEGLIYEYPVTSKFVK